MRCVGVRGDDEIIFEGILNLTIYVCTRVEGKTSKWKVERRNNIQV